jgi:ABC-type thiamin/hydroxymethylpyrimidine transport system permease subunit
MTTTYQAFDIGTSFQQSVDSIFSFLPKLLAFLIILIVGYLIAKVIKAVLNKILDKAKVDEKLQKGKAGSMVGKASPGGKPSHLIGAVVFWLIFLYALSAAISALQIPALTTFMTDVLAYLPNVIAALLILVVAAAIAGAVVAAVEKTMGDTPTGKMVETVVPALVMAIAMFMILTQLHIAPTIVIITYAAILGMLALAGALAFGLGGRDVAAKMWASAYEKGQKQAEQVKADAATGKDRAQQQAQQAKDKAYDQEADTTSQPVASGRGRRGGRGGRGEGAHVDG